MLARDSKSQATFLAERQPSPSSRQVCGGLGPRGASEVAIDKLSDEELALREADAARRVRDMEERMAQLRSEWAHHERYRRALARALTARSFHATSFGKLLADSVLPFLVAADVLRWATASPAASAQSWQLCAPRQGVCHLRGLQELSAQQAAQLVRRLHWPALRTLVADLRRPGWLELLRALAASEDKEQVPIRIQGFCVTFPTERSAASLQLWQKAEPILQSLSTWFGYGSQLQELVLQDLRSTDFLESVLHHCGQQLRVCRASFVGPSCRRRPLTLPSSLSSLECLMLKYRDFCEQRLSRSERMSVYARPLLDCLQHVKPRGLRVLALSGIQLEGDAKDFSSLIRGLSRFNNLAALALRFSSETPLGTLVPLAELLRLRCSWPRVAHVALGDASLHGFNYWPEQVLDVERLYPHKGKLPSAFEVFGNEFRHVLASQYNSSAEWEWRALSREQQGFWSTVADRLPSLPKGELTSHVAALFPSGLD